MKWQILIPSIEKRSEQVAKLKRELYNQILYQQLVGSVDIITLTDSGSITIGDKRNKLLEVANAEYISFFDDDDWPSKCYIERNFEGILKGVDCNSLMGVITWDGTNPELFEHSIKYKEYKTAGPMSGVKYERFPNHLNVIKRSIAKQFKFPSSYFGEDTDWATQVYDSGLIKDEHSITDIIYHYQFDSKK